MFATVDSKGEIINLGVEDSYLSINDYYVGAIVGYNNGKVENCYAKATVCGRYDVGVMVGYNDDYGKIKNCYSMGTASGTKNVVGGFVGYNEGVIEACYAIATVSGTAYVGGFVGSNASGINSCYCISKVNATSNVGGFFGTNRSITTSKCYYAENSNGDGTELDCIAGTKMPLESFASGEAADKLNGDDKILFGQIIGTDDSPRIYNESNRIYATKGCRTYNNDNDTSEKQHDYEGGICKDCKQYINNEPQKIDDVYQISNKQELYWYAYNAADSQYYTSAKLTADITINEDVLKADGAVADDTSGFEKWVVMGNTDTPYCGEFDGNGHVIRGLYFDDSEAAKVGLFGEVDNSTIKNLGVCDSYFKGSKWVGGICGLNDGTIQNCYFTGTVGGNYNVGGICGYNKSNGDIYNSYTVSTVNAKPVNEKTNPIYGMSDSSAICENSYYQGEVSSKSRKTAAQFANGEVAYLLSRGYTDGSVNRNGDIWGQSIGESSYPTLNGDTVYATSGCVTYSNDSNAVGQIAHVYSVNEICSVCGKPEIAEPQVLNGVYQISNKKELYWFAECVNGTLTDDSKNDNFADAELTADIVINEAVLKEDGTPIDNHTTLMQWIPIGDYISGYYGTFDGKGHTVSGIYANHDMANVGMFGSVYEGEIKNLTVKDSYFKTDEALIGAICGYASATNLTDCNSTAYVRGCEDVGGICGYGETAEIKNCQSFGITEGESDVSGICGYAYKLNLINCKTSGTVSGYDSLGGVCGYASNVDILNCTNSADIVGKTAFDVGGICGCAYESSIVNCTNKGEVGDASAEENIGGICGGGVDSFVQSSTNFGSVSGIEDVGGVCGDLEETTVRNCLNAGNVSGRFYAGGIMGYADSSIENCVNVGTVSAEEDVGGICSSADTVDYCYYLDTCEGADTEFDSSYGASVTAEELASGEIAYILQNKQVAEETAGIDHERWGQTLCGKDKNDYPVIGGDTVISYFSDSVFSNKTTEEFGALGAENGTGGKTDAYVNIPTVGTYTVVFADYENGRLNNIDVVEVTFDTAGENIVTSNKAITVGKGDKLMIWDGTATMRLMCDAYVLTK